jgi:hypothetical protein
LQLRGRQHKQQKTLKFSLNLSSVQGSRRPPLILAEEQRAPLLPLIFFKPPPPRVNFFSPLAQTLSPSPDLPSRPLSPSPDSRTSQDLPPFPQPVLSTTANTPSILSSHSRFCSPSSSIEVSHRCTSIVPFHRQKSSACLNASHKRKRGERSRSLRWSLHLA